jgi:methionyl-tRNA formyltransferase
MITIDFFLCGYKGLEVLKTFCTEGYSRLILQVVAARDKNVINDYFEEIKETCTGFNVNFKERDNENSVADYRFLIGWRWMQSTTERTIVLHDALLPAYRGFSPVVNALINGEPVTGATALLASGNYDAGPIIMSKTISINHPVRIQKVIEQMSTLYSDITITITKQLLEGKTLHTTPQDDSNASYSLWRDEQDYFIDWQDDDQKILRTIYALSFPYTGACTTLNGEKVTIDDAEIYPDVKIINRQPGKVIFMRGDRPVVVCGRGLLKITSAFDMNKISVLPLKKFRSRFGK